MFCILATFALFEFVTAVMFEEYGETLLIRLLTECFLISSLVVVKKLEKLGDSNE